MKQLKFLETKRTPRYSLRKFSVGMVSVLLGVTIFGINFTNHSVKAETIESVKTNTQKATGATGEDQRSSGSNTATANNSKEAATTLQSAPETQGSADTDINSSAAKLAATVDQNNTNTQKATSATEKVRQGSASKNATANNSTEAATTSQSAPKTQSSADTDIRSLDIRSLTAISAAKLATMNLMQTTGRERSAAATVNPDNINDQPAKENQKLANENNLTSSDNYSSNIYKGKDGKYYKIVTIYGSDYVYHAADIQANGTAFGQWATSAADTKSNINISKEDLGNGKTRWTVIFFPNKGLQNAGDTLHGLSSAKFGIALTNDYQIVGDVDMDITTDPNQTFVAHTFKDNSNRATDITVSNPSPEVKFSFNPNTDVDPNTGLINSKTMPAYNNQYLQGPYYFNTDAYAGRRNLWQTYFEDGVEYNNAYDERIPYLGGNHDFHLNNFEIKNKTGVDGAKQGDKIIYDTLGYRLNSKNANPNGVFSSDNFNQAMEFKSQGVTSQSQFSSYKISFTTQHTDSHEVELTTGPKNQQFSGIAANIYSYQNKYYNMFSSLYGEQRALNPADAAHPAPLNPKDIIPNWQTGEDALAKINKDYLNNAQINALSSEIHNNAADPDALAKIVDQGNALNDAMKKLGNSIGQYDPDGSFAGHKEDTTKASDRYKYASPDKKAAYDNATEVTKALINKDTGTYADKAKVEQLTDDENKAWSALDGKKPTDTESYHVTAKDGVSVDKGAKVDPGSLVNVTDPAGKAVELKPGSVDWKEGAKPDLSTYGDKTGKVEVTLPDGSKTEVPVHLHVNSDAERDHVTAKDGVSVDKGAKVDPGSLVNVTDPAGKAVELPAGSIDWKEGAKPDLSTFGDKTGEVEVTFLDGSKKDTDVTIYVKTDAETYDPQAQPWTTTVGKTPKADEVISSTDKNGKKMPSDAKYTWKTEPNTSKTGEAFGEVKVTYSDGSHDDVPVTINVKDKDKLNDKEKYHIYGKDGLKVDNGKTLDPKDTIVVKDIDGNQTTLPEGSTVKWTKGKEPDFSQAGKDVTGEVTVTYPDHTQSDSVTVTVHVNGESDEYKVAPRDGVTVQRGGQVDPESTVVAQTPDGKPTSFPDGTTHKWVTAPDTSTTGNRTGVVETTFSDGSTTRTKVTVKVQPNQSDKYDPHGPENPDDRVPVKDPDHLTKGDEDNVKGEVGKVNPDLPKGTEVTVDDKGNATIKYPDGSKDKIPGDKLVKGEDSGSTSGQTDAGNITPNIPGGKVTVKDPSHLTDSEKDQVKKNVEDANKRNFPAGTDVTVGKDGTATIKYPDTSTDTIPGDKLVKGEDSGSTSGQTDAENITPNVPGDKVTVKDPSHLTDDEKNQVKNNVDNANKDKFPDGTTVTVGDDGTATVNYPDGSQDTIPGDQLVQGQKGDTTDAGNITPTISGGKVTVKDPSHLTDDEKNQVKKNVEDANKDKFPAGTEVTVGDDGTTTVTYPDGSKDVIAGTDLVIAAKSEDVPGSKHHSHKNGSNSSQADRVKGASTANGSIANAGNNLGVKGESDNAFVGVKGESDNAIGNNKATSLKTLPQTGTKDTSILGVLGMLLASLGLFGFKKKRDKE